MKKAYSINFEVTRNGTINVLASSEKEALEIVRNLPETSFMKGRTFIDFGVVSLIPESYQRIMKRALIQEQNVKRRSGENDRATNSK